MNALVQHQLNELPRYESFSPPTEEGVRLDLKASALNHRDIWITKGKYPGLVFPTILGSDGAGVYKENDVIINPSIEWGLKEKFQGEDFRVLGMPDHGTFAEYIYINERNISPKPGHLNYFEAAALPLAGLTAFRALMVKCKPVKGEKVLISGIGGGVATMAFLLALANENEVYVTSSSKEKIKKAKELGAAGGVNYTKDKWVKTLLEKSEGIDVVIDSAGGEGFGQLLKACNPGARMAIYGGTRGKITDVSPQILFWKQITIFGSTMGSYSDFDQMLDFVSRHNITPIIDAVIPMSKAEKAFAIMEKGEQFGKIVLDNTR